MDRGLLQCLSQRRIGCRSWIKHRTIAACAAVERETNADGVFNAAAAAHGFVGRG